MAEHEEKLLKDYFQNINTEAEQAADIKLDVAIRRGMQQGSRARTSLRRGYGIVLFAIVAIALVIIVPWANQTTKPEHAQLPLKSWGQLEVFRPVAEDNMTVKSALDAGMVKQMEDSTVEVDGLKFTINGLIADRKGVIVLYTLQNNTDEKVQGLGLSIERDPVAIYHVSGFRSFSPSVREDDGFPGESRMIEQVVWEKYQEELPEHLTITLSIIPVSADNAILNDDAKKTELSIGIPMDKNKDYFQGEVVDLHENLSVAGQKINIDEVYIGPTGIYMNEENSEDNTMEIFSMIYPKLLIGEGDNQEELMQASVSSSRVGSKTSKYHINNRRVKDPIRLVVEGITALDKSRLDLVINTETKQILKAPDDHLSFSKEMDNVDQGIMILDLFIPIESGPMFASGGFSIDSYFVDGAGNSHWLERDIEDYSDYSAFKSMIGDPKGTNATSVYSVGKEKLPQPLTFKLSYYPHNIMESRSIRIK